MPPKKQPPPEPEQPRKRARLADPAIDGKVGREIAAELTRQGLTQEEFADRLAAATDDPTGAARSSVNRKLAGTVPLPLWFPVRAAQVLGVDIGVILQAAGLSKQRVTVREALLADDDLDEDIRRAMLEMLKVAKTRRG